MLSAGVLGLETSNHNTDVRFWGKVQALGTMFEASIRVNDKPIIQHVVELFPSESSFLFICNEDHLNTQRRYSMRERLEKIAPSSQIFSIPSHKLGPVNAVLQVADSIVDDEPCIISIAIFHVTGIMPILNPRWLSRNPWRDTCLGFIHIRWEKQIMPTCSMRN